MVRTQVASSLLASVGYDAGKELLEIEFVNGSIYQYGNVPLTVYQGLMDAESHGTYFNHSIKPAGYLYQQIK